VARIVQQLEAPPATGIAMIPPPAAAAGTGATAAAAGEAKAD